MARKHNKTGRSSGKLSSFIPIERYILRTEAWRHLSLSARAAYVQMGNACDGANNGRIVMSAQMLADQLGVHKTNAARYLRELIEKGFIVPTKVGYFRVKYKEASEFRLTAYSCNVTALPATKEFTRWRPENQEHGSAPATIWKR